MDSVYIIEENRYNILEILNRNDKYELEKYIYDKIILLNNINDDDFDILISAIESDVSIDMINFIILQGEYYTLDYFIIENNSVLTPIFSAVGKNRFDIADILLENQADINYFNGDILNYLYDQKLLNIENLKYILKKGLNIEAITTKFIYDLIDNFENNFLEIIFNHYTYTNEFILQLLKVYKNYNLINNSYELVKKSNVSVNDDFKNILSENNNKIFIDEKMYEKAIKSKNYEALKILFKNDNNEQDKILKRIIKYNLLERSVEMNDYSYVKKVLSYDPFNFKNIHYEEIIFKALQNNRKIAFLLLKSFIDKNNYNNIKKSNTKYDLQILNLIVNKLIKRNNFQLLKSFIEDDEFKSIINLNVRDINGEYPLHTAFFNDNIDIFKYLLKNGANGDIKNNNDSSLLLLAINDNKYEFVKCLVKHNSFINEKNFSGNSLLHISINQNNSNITEYLINFATKNNIPLNINEKDSNGEYLLIKAINKNNFNIVFSLVNYGIRNNVNLNIKDENGNTPLTISYIKGYTKIFKYLIKYLNINQKDGYGNSVLIYIIDKNDIDTLNDLIDTGININLKDGYNNSPFNHAIIKGNYEILKALLKNNNVELNSLNSEKETPLISIIKSHNFTCQEKEFLVNQLLKRGININLVGNENNTALIHSIQNGYFSIIELLIKNGADVNIVNNEGNSPLIYAIRRGYLPIVKLLIESKANVNIRNKYNYSPIDYSIITKNYKITKYLFDCGFNNFVIINTQKSFEGFRQIIQDGNLELLKLIMIKDFDVNTKNQSNGWTLLQYAIFYKETKIVQYLIDRGADKDIKNNDGKNAHDINRDNNRDRNFKKFTQTYHDIEEILQ